MLLLIFCVIGFEVILEDGVYIGVELFIVELVAIEVVELDREVEPLFKL